MLVLGRKEGETILIEGGIRIVVVACDKGGVRLGIEAPSALRILRGEIADEVARETQRASLSASTALPAGLAPRPRASAAPSLPAGTADGTAGATANGEARA